MPEDGSSLSRMNDTVRLGFREARARIRLRYQFLGLAAAVAVLAWLGPFDTWGRLSLPDRVGFWTLATSVNWLFGLVLGSAAGLAFERRGILAWAAAVVGGSAVAAVPGTAVVWLLVAAYMGHRMTGFAEIASLYSQVIVIHLVLNALVTWLIYEKKRAPDAVSESVSPHPAAEDPPFPSSHGFPSAWGGISCTCTCRTTTSRSTPTRGATSSSSGFGTPFASWTASTGRRCTARTGWPAPPSPASSAGAAGSRFAS